MGIEEVFMGEIELAALEGVEEEEKVELGVGGNIWNTKTV